MWIRAPRSIARQACNVKAFSPVVQQRFHPGARVIQKPWIQARCTVPCPLPALSMDRAFGNCGRFGPHMMVRLALKLLQADIDGTCLHPADLDAACS